MRAGVEQRGRHLPRSRRGGPARPIQQVLEGVWRLCHRRGRRRGLGHVGVRRVAGIHSANASRRPIATGLSRRRGASEGRQECRGGAAFQAFSNEAPERLRPARAFPGRRCAEGSGRYVRRHPDIRGYRGGQRCRETLPRIGLGARPDASNRRRRSGTVARAIDPLVDAGRHVAAFRPRAFGRFGVADRRPRIGQDGIPKAGGRSGSAAGSPGARRGNAPNPWQLKPECEA